MTFISHLDLASSDAENTDFHAIHYTPKEGEK